MNIVPPKRPVQYMYAQFSDLDEAFDAVNHVLRDLLQRLGKSSLTDIGVPGSIGWIGMAALVSTMTLVFVRWVLPS